ncbi:hypothetical protein GCM10010329_78270 [Streptomyces spiroverticillatus]|uniref:Uncharacterized protein n=1 Tax=Streptomyces finlayi TaxID=67296 RepID=A0A918X579_9ACTN|nr:hypothetical protein [Streptomyces finlayi]GHA43695.1 hypothetical protein GCM10010329_78270 [Streptomyces spiroverticillatus]GHD13220.1 hypothetical protein GCM10010334_71080 [Streptomyces finlayi]
MSSDTVTPRWIAGRLVSATTQFPGERSHEDYLELAKDLVTAAQTLLPQVNYNLVAEHQRRGVKHACHRAGSLTNNGCAEPGNPDVLRDYCRDLATALQRVQSAIPHP